jgi:hypothetical protein
MPMETFRQPSTSSLDRSQSDPTISDATPKINFKWKKDGKFAKDLICNLSGKSTNPDGSKRKNKEPDIPIAFYRSLKQVTIYEPNLSRVDMEDPKGLEVVLLLSAAVIRDVYFAPLKEAFNISEGPRRDSATRRDSGNNTQRKSSASVSNGVGLINNRAPTPQKLSSEKPAPRRQSPANDGLPTLVHHPSNPRPPPTDPRSQWELDAETQRLKKQVEYEERARLKAEKEETKRIKAMLEAEEKEARRKQAEIDKETERLRKEFMEEQRKYDKEAQQRKPNLPPRHSAPVIQQPYQQPYQQGYQQQPQYYRPQGYVGPFLAAPNQPPRPSSAQNFYDGPVLKPKRSSFFGLGGNRSSSDGGRKRSF